MSAPTVPIDFVQRTLGLARRRGIDTTPLLLAAGIALDVAANPQARVTIDQMTRVTREIWRATDDELFGVGRHAMPRGTFRMICLGLIHAPDLRSAVLRLRDFSTVLPGVPVLDVAVEGDIARVTLDMSELDDPEHLSIDLITAVVHRVLGWLIGQRIALHELGFPYPAPRGIAAFDAVFGRIPSFDAPAVTFTFDSSLLDAPLIRSESELLTWIKHSPSDLYATRDWGSAVADQVRAILFHGLRGPWPTPDEVAARLTFSLPHLRRLLREEGTSISAIREEILRDASIASLTAGEESVDALASRLGFSEASAFRRAFRRWTGASPGAYRPGPDAADGTE